MRRASRRRIAVVLACLALVAGACSGGDDSADDTTTTTATTAPTTTAPPVPVPVFPLTGVPTEGSGNAGRPAIVVKLDNVEPKARRQAGINQADVVYEERVEGSVTRLLCLFHSTDSTPVGPVRSARTSDIGLFTPLNRPYFAWSGANDNFAARIRQAAVIDAGYDRIPGEYLRDRGRPAPSNLMLKSTTAVGVIPPEGSGPPPSLFTFRTPTQAQAHLEPVAGVAVNYGFEAGAAPVEYRWDGAGWARTQKGTAYVDAAGVQVAPANVIVQFVSYASSGVNDQFGKPIPEAQLVGEGEAWVLTAGGVVVGRWQKPALEAITTYTDVDGNPIGLTPGRTWVALPSAGGASRL
ncbi:MAG: DUF3048 domain-containing protein [Acidimicrobiales bacterium]|nr:DUF3048 domain-containing protein [Acidimicrobiales bacterium]